MAKFVSFCMTLLLIFSSQIPTFAAEIQPPVVKSEAAVVLDSQTGAVIYAKNANERMYPASLTKIATAIYAIEKGNLDDIVTVSANAVKAEGTRVYLLEGEKVPLRKLLQGMLINSGNDAAIAVAEHLDGSVQQFAMHLNTYLKTKIGVTNTNFTNPNGLFDENHYTSAMDLALITNYAMKNPVFAQIFGTKELKWNGEGWNTTLITHHRMLKGEIPYPGITGGKTGYVDQSKQTLATTAENGKIKLTVIELKGNNKKDIYDDTIHLLDYGFHNYQNEILPKSVQYNVGKKEFILSKDTLITVPLNGLVKQVNSQGELSIKNSNGQQIQTIQLILKTKPGIEKEHKSIVNQTTHLNAFYGVAIFIIAGAILSLRNQFLKRSKA
ncbi:MAG: D-alanyl-D-alanine carboxypeptidase family protein [Bacillota bacterium]|nr:D-alanyl-D-alanine carboxypeptidase family protein [Bacillota bacterium]